MTRMIRLLIAAVVVAVVLKLFVMFVEARLAFFPLRGLETTPSAAGIAFENLNLTTADGEQLRAWRLLQEAPRAHVLYFHGNGGNLSVWLPILQSLHRRGITVLAVDYRGYGESSGAPSEQGLYRDADAVLEHFRAGQEDDGVPVLYWGRSIGGPVAAYAASVRPPDGLVLESSFSSMRSAIRTNPVLLLLSVFSSYRFPTAEFLTRYKGPVLVLHGDADSVVPYSRGEETTSTESRSPKTFYRIRGGDHNEAEPRDEGYWKAVDEFVKTARSRR